MIETGISGGVQHIRLNRPEKKNALTGDMYTAFAEALERGNAEGSGVRVHLVTGVPGAFTAGNDIGDFLAFASRGSMTDAPVARFLRALVACERPIVAAVDGLAIGVGTTMLLHCDMVLASPRSVFRTPFIDLGLVPEAGSSLLAPALMGHARAFELLCLGEAFDAEAACRAGFVNRIVAEEELEASAEAIAHKIAAKPQEALAISRRLLRGDRAALETRVEEEIAAFAARLVSPEASAAFKAFMERARPSG